MHRIGVAASDEGSRSIPGPLLCFTLSLLFQTMIGLYLSLSVHPCTAHWNIGAVIGRALEYQLEDVIGGQEVAVRRLGLLEWSGSGWTARNFVMKRTGIWWLE